MYRMKALILVTVLVVAATLGSAGVAVYASGIGAENSIQYNKVRQGWGLEFTKCQGSLPWLGELTEEQRETIKQTVVDMKDAGATWGEIKDAVVAQLQEWGIKAPEFQGPPHIGQFRHNSEYGNGLYLGQDPLNTDQFCPQTYWDN